MSKVEQTMSKEIDHRGDPLGPAWLHRKPIPPGQMTPSAQEWRHGVCASGRNRAAATRIVESIQRARETIIVSSFIMSDREIARAVLDATRRGVRAYVMLSAERVKKGPVEDDDFDQRVQEAERQLLTDIAGYALVRTASFFHAKVVLIDAPGGDGFLLTSNLTTEALERNEELTVALSPEQRAAIYRWISFAFWELAENEMLSPGSLELVKPAGWLKQPSPSLDALVTAPGSTTILEAARGIVERAQRELTVASFGWSADHPLVKLLVERAKSGLKVTALARFRPAAMKALVALRDAGATVLGFPFLHAKALWNDVHEALVTSANFEPHGLDDGFEVGVRLDSVRAEAIRETLASWAERAPVLLENNLRVGDIRGEVLLWNGRSLEKTHVDELREIDLGSVVSSADVPPLPPFPTGKLAQKTVARWRAQTPKAR